MPADAVAGRVAEAIEARKSGYSPTPSGSSSPSGAGKESRKKSGQRRLAGIATGYADGERDLGPAGGAGALMPPRKRVDDH